MTKRVVVIGAGFGGMSAAAYLAQAGYEVTVLEKNAQPGGRAAVLSRDGFTWDLGPSWYMMPDVFEEFFADFGKQPADYYNLQTLDPSCRVFDATANPLDIGDKERTITRFEALQPGAGAGLRTLLDQAEDEYRTIRHRLLPTDWSLFSQIFEGSTLAMMAKPSMLGSYHRRIARHVTDPRLQHVLEFTTAFLGGSPQNTPGMYGMLTHIIMGLGVQYPLGGFGAVARGFEALCKSLGVTFIYNCEAARIVHSHGSVQGVRPVRGEPLLCDAVVANADYHHVQTALLPPDAQDIPADRWRRKTLAPSALVVCLGVRKPLPNLLHHNLFFDAGWQEHFDAIFLHKKWNTDPLFYLCVPSKTDSSVAPPGAETLFVLAPQAAGEQPDSKVIQKTVDTIIKRIEHKAATVFTKHIVAQEVLAHDYFKATFNAYQGSAFGLSHTFFQSTVFRPRLEAKKLRGLYFAGQYTNPGIGVPMVVASGKLAAQAIRRHE